MEGEGGAKRAPYSVTEAHKVKLHRNLEKAQWTRKAIVALRAAIKSRQIDDIAVLKGNSDYESLVQDWPIQRLLLMMRGIGKGRTVDILDFTRIRPHTKIRRLSFAQRELLAEHVIEARKQGPYSWKEQEL